MKIFAVLNHQPSISIVTLIPVYLIMTIKTYHKRKIAQENIYSKKSIIVHRDKA